VAQLLDIYGFLEVLLRAATLSVQSLTVGGLIFIAVVARPAGTVATPLIDRSRIWVRWSALTLIVLQLLNLSVGAALLMATADLPLSVVIGANFVTAGIIALGGAVTIALLARTPSRGALALSGAAALAIIGASVATSHAAARVEHRNGLLAVTYLHQLATAAWVGGLPYLLLALARVKHLPDAAAGIAGRFSDMAQASVATLVGAGFAMAWFYIGSVSAAYGTTYGIMLLAKVALLGMLLLLGALNRQIVRELRGGEPTLLTRLRRFGEAEVGIGFTAILTAASLTSQPPAIDVTQLQLPAAEIAARVAPRWPRLASPDVRALTPVPDLGAPLDTTPDGRRLESFVPGETVRTASPADRAWSEYNHHWSGLVVLAIGLLALVARTSWGRWARHWPLAFLALAAFLFVRADAENWPLGHRGFWESFQVAEVAQHRLFVLLIVAFAIFEWGVRTGRLTSRAAALVFPLVCATGGALLMAHSHSLGNVKEEFLAELSHTPLALLGVAAGWSRWLELRLPERYRVIPARIWPLCFVLVGVVLLLYRES